MEVSEFLCLMTSFSNLYFAIFSDFSFNNPASPFKTPNIDALAVEGIQLDQHYMHSLCTPSRAALMTGRYHIHTGLTYVLAPGTAAGLPTDIPTLPSVLKDQANYSTTMVGKWHLGHAKQKQTPTGRGFEKFTGIYTWDTDSYTKQMSEIPWEDPMFIDWVKESDDGQYYHYAEPRHSTEAITSDAQVAIVEHKKEHGDNKPLFLYVAYTAAHSPLQPLPRHEAACEHIPHLWRRQFCGMVQGLDEGIFNITQTLRQEMGENTIVVVTSDNGGSVWFGGNNTPLRGCKNTPYEGGLRVPGFILDLSPDQRFLGYTGSAPVLSGSKQQQKRVFKSMMHVSDWMPTLLSFAGIKHDDLPQHLDGFDFSSALRETPPGEQQSIKNGPRSEMLLEMYFPEEFIFGEGQEAYRIDDWKLIKGIVRDENYYYESQADHMNFTTPTWFSQAGEKLVRVGDWIFGNNRFDLLRITMTHMFLQGTFTYEQKRDPTLQTRLFNLADDPNETKNLAHEPWAKAMIEQIEQRLAHYKQTRAKVQPSHLIFSLDEWSKTHVSGNCSMNPNISARQCRFTHPWIADDVEDVFSLPGQLFATDHAFLRIRDTAIRTTIVLFLVFLIYRMICLCWKQEEKVCKLTKKKTEKAKKH